MGKISDFISGTGEVLKDMLSMPYEAYKDGEKVLGLAVGTLYLGVASIIGLAVFDSVKNPEYKYTDVDHGVTAVFDVTPSKNQVLERLSPAFGKYADFTARQFCDASFGKSTSYVPVTYGSGDSSFTMQTPVESETMATWNCRSFNQAAGNAADGATVQKMTGYLAKAQKTFSARLF